MECFKLLWSCLIHWDMKNRKEENRSWSIIVRIICFWPKKMKAYVIFIILPQNLLFFSYIPLIFWNGSSPLVYLSLQSLQWMYHVTVKFYLLKRCFCDKVRKNSQSECTTVAFPFSSLSYGTTHWLIIRGNLVCQLLLSTKWIHEHKKKKNE